MKFLIKILLLFLVISSVSAKRSNRATWSEPENLMILNSSSDDFAPSWNSFEKTLYFNSTRKKYSYFYQSKTNDFIGFSSPKLVKGELNKNRNNQSYISFLTDEEAYLSTFRLSESGNYLNIYRTFKIRQSWDAPIIVDSLKTDNFCSHPTISPSGEYMVFSTDRNSDYDDADLWMAIRGSNGFWGGLVSLNELNSSGNEITPFFAGNDTLYFASDGQEGPGGYDLFFSVKVRGQWQRPSALTQLNTEFNESDLCVLPSGDVVFASDRPGGQGDLDLYLARKNIRNNHENEIVDLEVVSKSNVENINIIKENTLLKIPVNDYIKGIPSDDFNYSFLVDSTINSSYITDDNYVIYEKSKVLTEPEIVEFSIDSRPVQKGVNWSIKSITLDRDENEILSGDNLPFEFELNLDSLLNSNSDYSNLRFLTGAEYKGNRDGYILQLNPITTIINKPFVIEKNSEFFEVFLLPVEGYSQYDNLISEIIESSKTSLKIILESTNGNALSEIKTFIRNKVNIPVESTSNWTFDAISKELLNHYVVCKVKKIN